MLVGKLISQNVLFRLCKASVIRWTSKFLLEGGKASFGAASLCLKLWVFRIAMIRFALLWYPPAIYDDVMLPMRKEIKYIYIYKERVCSLRYKNPIILTLDSANVCLRNYTHLSCCTQHGEIHLIDASQPAKTPFPFDAPSTLRTEINKNLGTGIM